MGFFNFFSKVPRHNTGPTDDNTNETAQSEEVTQQSTRKVIPEVSARRVKSHLDSNGQSVTIWAVLHNDGAVPVFVDKVDILGQRRELDRVLAPAGSHEFEIYRGAVMKYGNYTSATVNYRDDSTGDYFQARYRLRYDLESNGVYLLDEMVLERPVRDI